MATQPPVFSADRRPGVRYRAGTTTFTLYAPNNGRAVVVLPDTDERRAMVRHPDGYFTLAADDLRPGTPYLFQVDKQRDPRPDPASLSQPEGVHGHSAVVDADLFTSERTPFGGRGLENMIIYELHVGTFSEDGTFDGAIEHLPDLVRLGVNTIQMMPVNQFPGTHNWGYDGVYWQAAQSSYGGPEGLVRLIDAAHELDLAVVIDAVFNHLGPEGNYLPTFAPYLTEKHHTPWGPAVNLDDYHCNGVRDLILTCCHTWLVDYRADGLRLDAVHALKDSSATHLLEELSTARDAWQTAAKRPLTLIAELDLNDPSYVRSRRAGGYGLDGQWVDEFHHALRAYLTGEKRSYYSDFGSRETLVKVLRDGYAYTGQHSRHRGRRFGRPTTGLQSQQLIVFGQNHDQVGNRARGERLTEHLREDTYLLVAATVIWSPFTPMLWMGEEYAEPNPFPYFVSHGDEAVLRATREGRMREFAPFVAEDEEVPDPGSPATFASAKLGHRRRGRIYDFYREALAVRRQFWPLRKRNISAHTVDALADDVIGWRIPIRDNRELLIAVNYSRHDWLVSRRPPTWAALDTADLRYAISATRPALAARSAAVWVSA